METILMNARKIFSKLKKLKGIFVKLSIWYFSIFKTKGTETAAEQ